MELTTRTAPTRKHIALVARPLQTDVNELGAERHQPLLEKHVLLCNRHHGNLIQRANRYGR